MSRLHLIARRSAWVAPAVAVALLACGGEQVESVRPQLVPPADVIEFGEVPVLNEHKVDIRVLNVGKGLLTVSNVSITEADVPFRVLGFEKEIGPSEEKPIQVAFVPPLEGDYSATLVLETDDPTNPTVQTKLVGKGSTRAIIEVDPGQIDFDRVAEDTSAVKTFVIRSKGTADLILEDISFVDGSSANFEFLGSVKTPAVVPHTAANGLPGQIQVTVRYTVAPGAPDMSTAQIRIRSTDPERREVIVPVTGLVNRAPIAHIKELGVGSPGMEVTLDGSMSSDPDNDVPLTYKWVLRSKPLGAMTSIVGDEQPVTSMTLDPTLPGEYVVELRVTDAAGAKNVVITRASIVAAPAQKLLIEMFWNNTVTDIDLHMLRTPTTQVGSAPNDCFYQNPTPDWGVPGDDTDDPEHLKDALTGFGPEVIGYVNPPENSTFRIVAEYRNDNLAKDKTSEVTVRIYQFGVVKFEQKKVLVEKDQMWAVADIEWPSGKITVLEP